MSRRERERLTVMAGVRRKELSLVQAGGLLGLSYRQTKRVWWRVLPGRPKPAPRKRPAVKVPAVKPPGGRTSGTALWDGSGSAELAGSQTQAFGGAGRADSSGRGQSVARDDRRRREVEFADRRRRSPGRLNPARDDALIKTPTGDIFS